VVGRGARPALLPPRLDNCLVVRDRLASLRANRDSRTGRPLDVSLLVFEPSAFGEQGRVAIGIGDVDTADHVAVLVPGLGSDVRSYLGPLTDNALRVHDHARRAAGQESAAAVAWMAYDAPELGGVAADGAAERGADLLAADLLGWQAARATLPHLTVVGHSYGSTTAGTSLRDHSTGTDDLVLLGSPGPNVETVSELRVPSGHVYVGSSSRDPVSYLDRFGADPTHQDFGAIRFQAEDVTRNDTRLDVADHSKYYDRSSESLANVVRVVVGDYAAVRPAEYRGEAWFRPDGINDDPEADREPTVAR
jgi:pimeloyl-ACP methyl ester carboxylesterase